ncbi:hypothetical protein PInf_004341 [Phytophthora infestans]|nr:hypothetical protein PInf_004341 [Phytophthora infestans]
MAFRTRWAELKKVGWMSKRPSRLSNLHTYIQPDKTRNGERGEDYFVGEEELMKYLNQIPITDVGEECDELVTLDSEGVNDDEVYDITCGELNDPTDLAGQDEEVVIQPEMLFDEDILVGGTAKAASVEDAALVPESVTKNANIATSPEDGRARTILRSGRKAKSPRAFLRNKAKHIYDGKARNRFDIWHECWRNGLQMMASEAFELGLKRGSAPTVH